MSEFFNGLRYLPYYKTILPLFVLLFAYISHCLFTFHISACIEYQTSTQNLHNIYLEMCPIAVNLKYGNRSISIVFGAVIVADLHVADLAAVCE